jgi:xanthine dehydrogenase accessory factor
MLEIAGALLESLERGHRLAVSTVSRVTGSAPRTLGTSMAVDELTSVIGSISGGCVEGEIIEVSEQVLAHGQSTISHFGVTESAGEVEADANAGDLFASGLNCGGEIEVITVLLGGSAAGGVIPRELRTVLEAARDGRATGLALIVSGAGAGDIVTVSGSGPADDTRGPSLHSQIKAELMARIHGGVTTVTELDCGGEFSRVLFLVSAPPPRMIIFGAVDFAAALSAAAALLGYQVTVCDARAVFATRERFPHAHDVIVEWPPDYLARTLVNSRTVLCVLSHDDKVDVPLIAAALALPAGYVGAMGSRRTHDRRLPRLREAGVSESQLDRLHSPIGLDLGASTPEETAISILAEVLAARTGASGTALRNQAGPIHRPAPPEGS